ncbi:MAG: hypothetical protein GF310_11405 [candidate division Zixibacteria bacterium]|nr:hypothetical protein [candidate division Zixibacteria bacterium]
MKRVLLMAVFIAIPLFSANGQALFVVGDDNFDFSGMEFQPDTLVDTLVIANGGSDPLNWTATWSTNWLTVEPASGTAPSALEIMVTAESLAGGDYTDQIVLESAEAANSPYTINVLFNVEPEVPPCPGICGDANVDGAVALSDAVWIINYIFLNGARPGEVLACGDVNGDCKVNISDSVSIINYVFIGGAPPDDCCPGGWEDQGGDCCPF